MLNSKSYALTVAVLNYKFRLYPTRKQEQLLEDTFEVNRIVYNFFVSNGYRDRNEMNYALTELKEQQPILRNYHSKMLQMVSTKVAGAWEALAALKKHGREAGNGRLGFLGQGECNSFSYNQSGFTIDGNRLHLSKIGMIKIKLHRLPAQIKQVTIMKKNERWYAIVTCGILRRTCSVLTAIKPIGIDVEITHFAYDSDGNSTKNPLFLKEMQEPLKRAQRKVSRKRKGSNNRKKAKSRLARLHEKITNRRRDFLHKLSSEYSNKHDIIFLERLRTFAMVKNHSVARYVFDSSWRTFKTMLDYKANRVVEVEPWNTSILCSKCGSKVPKSLAMRTHQCGKCQLAIDRDYNASLNILQRGRILLNLPAERREVTPAEIAPLPTTVGGQVQSLKQEAHTVKHVQFTGNCMRL